MNLSRWTLPERSWDWSNQFVSLPQTAGEAVFDGNYIALSEPCTVSEDAQRERNPFRIPHHGLTMLGDKWVFGLVLFRL